MKVNTSRIFTLATLLACITVSVSAQNNAAINFDTYPTGALSADANSPWVKSGRAFGTIEAATDGGKFLRVDATGPGAIIFDTAHETVNSILLQESEAIRWGFEFMLPSGSEEQTTYLRLNPGLAGVGKYIAGFAIIDGKFSWLRNPNIATARKSFVIAPRLSLQPDVWYRVEVEITDAPEVSDQFICVMQLATSDGTSLLSQTVTTAPNALSEDPLRMTISLDGTSDLQLRNILLNTLR